jgi:hypothetical protein
MSGDGAGVGDGLAGGAVGVGVGVGVSATATVEATGAVEGTGVVDAPQPASNAMNMTLKRQRRRGEFTGLPFGALMPWIARITVPRRPSCNAEERGERPGCEECLALIAAI